MAHGTIPGRVERRRGRPKCTFCSEKATVELTGHKEDDSGMEVVYACWRSQHETKGRAYLSGRNFGRVMERQL